MIAGKEMMNRVCKKGKQNFTPMKFKKLLQKYGVFRDCLMISSD